VGGGGPPPPPSLPLGKFAQVSGGKVALYYEVHGHGPEKVLMIMGLSTTFRGWNKQLEFFKAYHDQYQVCVFDNRGVGRSSSPRERFTTTKMAKDTKDLLEILGWNEFHLVGISMGGMIATELALMIVSESAKNHSTEKSETMHISTLTLAVTHSGGPYASAPLSGIVKLLSAATKKTIEERGSTMLPMIYSTRFLNEEVEKGPDGKAITNYDVLLADLVARSHLDPPQTKIGMIGHISAISTHYVSNKRLKILKEKKIPILIMTGTVDHLVRPINSHRLKKVLEPVEFVVFEGAGHGIIRECNSEFNAALLRPCNRGSRGVYSSSSYSDVS